MAVVSAQDSPPLSQPVCGWGGYATVFINGARIFHIDRDWPRKNGADHDYGRKGC